MKFTMVITPKAILFLAVLILFVAFVAPYKPSPAKVAYANTGAILEGMPEKKNADSVLNKQTNEYMQYISEMEKTYNERVLRIKAPETSEELKKVYTEDCQKIEEKVEKFKLDAQQELLKKREELYKKISDKITFAVEKTALSMGYDYVLESGNGAILFNKNKADDITELVKKSIR